MRTRYSSEELTTKLTAYIEELAKETDAARVSEAMIAYLELLARFHKYSSQNLWLILMARPNATYVAGYKRWRSMGRYVRKGERGIPILAPVTVKLEEGDREERKLVGFRVVYVFDVSQTEGKPLPEPPNWKSPDKNELLSERLTKYANDNGITVTVQELTGDIQGISAGGSILLAPAAGAKTLIHEIAHELMHRDGDQMRDNTLLELEAESVAYVVSRHFGLDGLASPNYITLHGVTSDLILEHLARIRTTAAQIISAIEKEDDIPKI